MFYRYRPFVGACCILVGVVILIFTIGQLIFRVLTALFAIGLINFGLHLYQLPSISVFVNRLFFRKF